MSDAIQAACSAQWQAERAGKNQYDAMAEAIHAYLLALSEREKGDPTSDSVRGFDPIVIEAIAREEFEASQKEWA